MEIVEIEHGALRGSALGPRSVLYRGSLRDVTVNLLHAIYHILYPLYISNIAFWGLPKQLREASASLPHDWCS